jgi:23S rRNA (uracil1939-C5)-methyltransferase
MVKKSKLTGLTKGVIQTVLQANPNEMIYVSCMPSTLARDLAFFIEKGYTIQQDIVYDMFPQTAHVETFVYLKKKKEYNRSALVKKDFI